MAEVCYDSVVFSPHPDDAVFSLGAALLTGLLGKTKIINVFSRSIYTVHSLGDEQIVTSARLMEDAEAARQIGADVENWNFSDSSLRPGYPDEDSYLHPDNDPVSEPCFDAVAERIGTECIKNSDSLIFAPLGLGHHIDHAIVATACRRSAAVPVFYYEDGSYFNGDQNEALVRAAALGLDCRLSFDAGYLAGKMRLVQSYSSQLDAAVVAVLHATYQQCGGERIWLASGNRAHLGRLHW